ncbi:hypothetical protein [Microbacterium sp. NPDC078849]|uniref:hypothetical protein n=1 Tax=unclassified Microbacterium TaxID=2609290 RepID=UPI003450125D
MVGTAPPDAPKGRVYRAAASGTAPATRVGRVFRAAMAGTASVIINAFLERTVEPMSTVSVTAVLSTGLPADSYSWRQVSGPAVAFAGSGATRSFVAPSSMAGTTVVIGVRATVGGTTSEERTLTVKVLPQIVWMRTNDDPVWRGAKITL